MTRTHILLLCVVFAAAGLYGCPGGGGGGGSADGGPDGETGGDAGDDTGDTGLGPDADAGDDDMGDAADGDAPDGDTPDADDADADDADTGDTDDADTGPVDSDGDGVPDTDDLCEGFDDNIDADLDNIPDGCDPCIRPGVQGENCPGTSEFDSAFGDAGIVMVGMDGRDIELTDLQYSPTLGLVIAGNTRDTDGDLDFFVGRLGADGAASEMFDEDGFVSPDHAGRDDQLSSIVLARDGSHILAAGSVVDANGIARPSIVKITAEGRVDVAYGEMGWAVDGADVGTWDEIVLDTAGNALAAGTNLITPSTVSLRRYLAGGGADANFTLTGLPALGVDTVVRAVVQGPGDITYIAGHTEQGYDDDAALFAINAGGTQHDGFNSGAPVQHDYTEGRGDGMPGHAELSAESIHAVVVDAQGRIVVTGEVYRQSDGGRDMVVARYLADGSPDAAFGTNGVVTVDFAEDRDAGHDLAIDAQGRIVAVGRARRDGKYGVAIARLLADGTLDAEFGEGGRLLLQIGETGDRADAVAIQADGRIVVAGRSDVGTRRQALILRIWD